MIGWLLNVVYALLLIAASPILVWRAVMQGKYRRGWGEKLFGRLPRSVDGERLVWLHAVSVGEVLQLRTIITRLQERRPDVAILITTTTITGHALAHDALRGCRICYFPLDFTWAVRTALRRVKPLVVGLVELELWPNLIRETSRAGIPLMLINGRISTSSYRGYRRVRFLMRPLLREFRVMAVQTPEYAQRFLDLGARNETVRVTGSLKFDGVDVERFAAQRAALREFFGIRDNQRVFVAGSTHAPEEVVALDAWQGLRAEFPELRLILAPRHPERFDEVAALVQSRGLNLLRRSRGDCESGRRDSPVCLLDTLGELSACWGLADVAFVGGSLTRRGGQNMIEPAAWGVPVIVGSNTTNFRDVVQGLQSVNAICVVATRDELAMALGELLSDRVRAELQGSRARDFVHCHLGATERTIALMEPLLPTSPTSQRDRFGRAA